VLTYQTLCAKHLDRIEKPGRYLGTELNSVHKGDQLDRLSARICLAFPDVYEVGMSHFGLKILYHLANKRSEFWAERVFAPWPDMEKVMEEEDVPLMTLESSTPLSQMDMIGFTLQYELSFTNILHMLRLSRLEIRRKDRKDTDPLVIAGGPCAFNPEPLADFFDAFVIGDGEEVFVQILEILKEEKTKAGRLEAMSKLQGVYLPDRYSVSYNPDGTISSISPDTPVAKAVVKELRLEDYPTDPVVPYIQTVHDRVNVEVFRGCVRGCRFCQAGMIYRPTRERSKADVKELVLATLEQTGYEEVSLTSLSTADYTELGCLVPELMQVLEPERVSLSLPSLRIDSFSVDIAREIEKVKKTGLTFAPEAGSQRLRDLINKNVSEEDLLNAAEAAFKNGWTHIKLYFMIGLPTETDEDVLAIAALGRKVRELGLKYTKKAAVTVSTSSFVPKSHTPFQWVGQETKEELRRKQFLLKDSLKGPGFNFSWNDPETSYLESVIARGDRRLGEVIARAEEKGAVFDSWSDFFKPEIWQEAFAECGLDPDFYARRPRDKGEILPWDVIDSGVTKRFLWREWEKALRGETTADCREVGCTGCGVCPGLDVSIVLGGEPWL
jgi:radical SAM family uncharacterized protein